MRWSKVEEIYGPDISASSVFDPKTDEGRERLKELHKRVIEHVSWTDSPCGDEELTGGPHRTSVSLPNTIPRSRSSG
jgi:hypothetical protein